MNRFLAVMLCGILSLSLMSCQVKTELPLPASTLTVILPEAYPGLQSQNSAYPIAEGGQNLPTQITPNPPADAPQPEPGKASISGTLYSPTQKMVIPDTQFYLTLGWGEDQREVPPVFIGPQVDKGDINLSSDSQGNFSANNIPPGNYYLVVWAPMTWDIAQISESDTQPYLLEIRSDQKYPLGIVYISWP
jgi:hypothetical protein